MKIQILDLDGCISDDRWRRRFIRPNEKQQPNPFKAYHAGCWLDEFVNRQAVIRKPNVAHVVFTGRPVAYHSYTMDWLRSVHIDPLHVIMRNNHDHTPSPELKERMLHALFDPNSYNIHPSQVIGAIDDRSAIVDMYIDNGIDARVVRVGEEEHVNG